MEKNHKSKIFSNYSFLDLPQIENLDIPEETPNIMHNLSNSFLVLF